ncbi:MAG: FadR family transcriptional regulator [Lachnospiraceae bacterium]|nr:FadR family transcriptional regulator [Lachnospiraceae bacterium]MBQ2577361.1 FadR family transcriptional regulator [Lachnospiraceae bacterium]MBQ5484233.1 FadR family transcriptional regulator [Lachnospiraceae bacterium]
MKNENNEVILEGKSERIYKTLMDSILEALKNGTLNPGDRLPPERKWAEEMKVSRSAVREAVRALEMIGLVSCRQGGGTFINENYRLTMFQPMTISHRLNHGTLSDIQEYRQCLEIQAAKLAALHATDEDIRILESLVRKMNRADNTYEGSIYDRNFHSKIAEISGNCLIRDSLASVEALLDEIIDDVRSIIFQSARNTRLLHDQHQQIIDSLRNHDAASAGKYMSEHMELIVRLLK